MRACAAFLVVFLFQHLGFLSAQSEIAETVIVPDVFENKNILQNHRVRRLANSDSYECAAEIDLIILVDGSKSVTQANFLLVKEWIKNLAKSFNIESGKVLIGVVQYSYWNRRRPMWRQSYIKTEIKMGEYRSLESFNRAVNRMRYQGYQTFTAHALTKIIDYDFQGRNSRYPEAQRAIILLTDGKATDSRDLRDAVDHAEKDGGASIFAVGVGDYSITELRLVTRNDRRRIFELRNFSELQNIVYELPRLLQGACDCDPRGSLSEDCDVCTRQCVCKTNVVGRRCDNCAEGTWNIANSGGCLACGCNPEGTKEGGKCSMITGACDCQLGVVGEQCDRCRNGRYGFPECDLCECNGFSKKCNKVTGICIKCEGNRVGDHCETCTSGYYKSESGECVPCQCNGHINVEDPESCEVETGECLKCLDGTFGRHCELCDEYSYRDDATGLCQNCECNTGGTDISTCSEGRCTCDQVTGQCTCKSGVTGLFCGQCEDGYWGFETEFGCSECNCRPEGSIESTCDLETGECECLPGYIGSKCGECDSGYFTEIAAGTCQACDCSIPGTDPSACAEEYCECDTVTGQCPCLPGFVGEKCSLCDSGFWNSGIECEACGCDVVGSLSGECDQGTGQCLCLPGYVGKQCNLCVLGMYRSKAGSCVECQCNSLGSTTSSCEDGSCKCENDTGQCLCHPNVIGIKCDECADGFWNFQAGEGCQPCGCHGRGSTSNICDKNTGECECLDGHTGPKCAKCESGHSRPSSSDSCEACDCDPGGTDLSTCDDGICSCDSIGQCTCLPNVAGLFCDVCADGYWNFRPGEGCEECGCHHPGSLSTVCSKTTGECECLPGQTGPTCDKCERGFARTNLLDTCKDCECNEEGTDPFLCEDGYCACDATTGQCSCLPGVSGLDCSQCEDGFWDLIYGEGCRQCACSISGSSSPNCDKGSGECDCLPGFTGDRCDTCVQGYSLTDEGACVSCECVLLGTDKSFCEDDICSCDGQAQCQCLLYVSGSRCDHCQNGYWDFGSDSGCKLCACDKIGSLSGSCDQDTGDCECLPSYTGAKCDNCETGYFRPDEFDGCKECGCNSTGTDLHTCIDDQCSCDAISGQCQCLPNVLGTICDECADGFWNLNSGRGCEPCGCHGSGSTSSICNKLTGQCDCLPGHSGKSCEECMPGHARANGESICTECDCDLSGTNTASCDERVCTCNPATGQCPCLPNVLGLLCNECSDGYWDLGRPEGCQECQCDPLGSISQICDKVAGECECLPGHTGTNCDECEKGYSRKHKKEKCKACRCDANGTTPSQCKDGLCACNAVSGQCPCLPGVTGLLCTRCEDKFWGLISGEGCKPCECSTQGSRSLICDKGTGQCQCIQGHSQRKCDRCDRGYYRINPEDTCRECKCDMYGRDPSSCGGNDCNCDISTGQCACLSNVTGLTCDRCEDGYWDIRSMAGCKPCECNVVGSKISICEKKTGDCNCVIGHVGRRCESCDKGYARSNTNELCRPDTLNDRTKPSTTTPTEKPVTKSTPRPHTPRPYTPRPYTPSPYTTRYVRPAPPPTRYRPRTTYSGCRRCMQWPSYCHGSMCRRRWPYQQFKPSPRRCNYGHMSCQYNVAKAYGQYGSRYTTAKPRTRATARPFYGYSLYGNTGSHIKYYPRRTVPMRTRSRSYSARSRPVSYGLYRSLYGRWK